MINNDWFKLCSVYDRKTKDKIDVSRITLEEFTSMHRLFLDGNLIKKHNNFMCEYECKSCNRLNIVTLNNIARKLNKGMMRCTTCKEYDDMKENAPLIRLGVSVKENAPNAKISLIDNLDSDMIAFNNEEDDFKVNYFRKHLTCDEFDRVKDKIISFQHEKFSNLDDFVYYPCVKISNQTRYNPYLYDKSRDVLEKIQYINFKCDCCDDMFYNRDLYIQKNKYKILCGNCNFTNNTFKIRNMKNCLDHKIQYQSQFEKKFVTFCNEHDIVVENGPCIPYEFNGLKKYKVDFALPDHRMLIEIKDNHIWHKQNIESGKWQAKQDAAAKYITEHDHYKEFIMVFPKNYVDITNGILKMANKI